MGSTPAPQAADKKKKAGKMKKERVSDPVENFEQLWQAFEKRYAFFDVRGVDWKKQYDTYRPLVKGKTSDDVQREALSPKHQVRAAGQFGVEQFLPAIVQRQHVVLDRLRQKQLLQCL